MSCISSNFSSFFLNSLNDPSEFSKYLSNGELRFSSTFEDFPAYGQNNGQQQQPQNFNGTAIDGEEGNSNIENTQPVVTSVQHYGSYHHAQNQQQLQQHHGLPHQQQQMRWALPHQQANNHQQNLPQNTAASAAISNVSGAQHFDGSFEFMKYLRHSNDYNENSHDANGQQNSQQQQSSSHATAVGTKPEASVNSGLMDLDSAHKRASARKTPLLSSANSNHHNPTANNSSHPTPMDIYDHDSKHNIYDLHHMNSVHSSNSNESSMELSSMTYPNSHLNASNSNTSSEGGNTQTHSDFSMLSGVSSTQNSSTANAVSSTTAAAPTAPAAPKPLASFTIKDNFEAHPSHKVEEGIFQHMNKLPPKKKDNLKQLGVRFTGQMTLNDKSIIVENFIKFCQVSSTQTII